MKPLLDAANHAVLGHGFEGDATNGCNQVSDVVSMKLTGVSGLRCHFPSSVSSRPPFRDAYSLGQMSRMSPVIFLSAGQMLNSKPVVAHDLAFFTVDRRDRVWNLDHESRRSEV